MTIAFFSVILNNHQANVANEFYKILGDDYTFVELCNLQGQHRKGSSEDYSKKPYLLKAWESNYAYNKAMELAKSTDVCVFSGFESLPFEKERLKLGLLSFDMSERLLKKGILNLLSPRIFRQVLSYHLYGWKHKPLYKLCCSAFTKPDDIKLGLFKSKHYKWGYFTKVENFTLETSSDVSRRGRATILWCARFLSLKHPELPIQLAKRLKDEGYDFHLDMIGSGERFDDTVHLSKSLGVEDRISFLGNMPNDDVLKQMRLHQIFLFTSDKHEGWGAVANEAMSNGCVLVCSDAIGSVPYLVNDGENGIIFKSCNSNSLYEKVKYILDNPEARKHISSEGFKTMQKIWSPKIAAKNLIQLIDDLSKGRESSIITGPCSKA